MRVCALLLLSDQNEVDEEDDGFIGDMGKDCSKEEEGESVGLWCGQMEEVRGKLE